MSGWKTRISTTRTPSAITQSSISTKRLATQLEQGKGREETRPTARRVGSFLRDTRADARGAVASATMLKKIEAANATIAELAVMYGVDPDDVALPSGR